MGARALKGEMEEIKTKLFDEVEYPRTIIGTGLLIQVYDPKADMASLAYGEWESQEKEGKHIVPAGYKVRVVGATVMFT